LGALSSLGPRYPLFESKFHRDSDFETPVAVFVLEVERYAVTSGTVVRAIELAEPIVAAALWAVCLIVKAP
jgi:hypothetical protein